LANDHIASQRSVRKDSVFAAEVFRRLGFEDGEELFENLSKELVVSTSFVAPRVNPLDLLSDDEAKPTDFLLTWTF